MFPERKKSVFYVLAFLGLLNVFVWLIVYDLSKACFLEVTFLDVGQGDAIFIETPQRNQILIDGGPNSAILEKLNTRMPFWDRTIDLIILTHPESDHLTGLIEVLKRYKVENILWTGIIRDTNEYQEWEKLVENEDAEIKIAQAGQRINLSTFAETSLHLLPRPTSRGSASEVDRYIEILYPFESLAGQEFKDSNNSSIVAKLVFGKNSFLFTGDTYKSVEKELIEKGISINSDVLKVAHHGSKTSTSQDFVREVFPQIAVISAGRNNSYGHPHQETLDTLAKYDITIFRTDLQGDIEIISDGKNYGVSTF